MLGWQLPSRSSVHSTYLADGTAEALRVEGTCLKSHSKLAARAWAKTKYFVSLSNIYHARVSTLFFQLDNDLHELFGSSLQALLSAKGQNVLALSPLPLAQTMTNGPLLRKRSALLPNPGLASAPSSAEPSGPGATSELRTRKGAWGPFPCPVLSPPAFGRSPGQERTISKPIN